MRISKLVAIDEVNFALKNSSVLPRRNMEFVPGRNDIDFIFVADPDAGRQIKPTLHFILPKIFCLLNSIYLRRNLQSHG